MIADRVVIVFSGIIERDVHVAIDGLQDACHMRQTMLRLILAGLLALDESARIQANGDLGLDDLVQKRRGIHASPRGFVAVLHFADPLLSKTRKSRQRSLMGVYGHVRTRLTAPRQDQHPGSRVATASRPSSSSAYNLDYRRGPQRARTWRRLSSRRSQLG